MSSLDMKAQQHELLALQNALAGRYTVERELGRGGMGVVYLARDLTLERQVAIKLLPAALAAQPELRARFLRETRTAAGLSHPNIVPIYSVEEQHGLVFFAMGYVNGETLAQRVGRVGPLPASEVARLLQDAAWALSYAHGCGIVHRDVKPDNILIERATGRAFITDFGIARVANSTLTAVGASLGTPQFMSPEQAAGESVDARSDLYSLGVVGYFALTGTTPFDGPTVQSILAMHLTKPAPPVGQARPGIPPRLAEVVDRCLAKEPDQRFASGDKLVTAVQKAQGDSVTVAPQVRLFKRGAEMSMMQLYLAGAALYLVYVLHRPAGHAVILVVALVCFFTVFMILGQARNLLDQGFGLDDVRALFASDAAEQEELIELAKARAAAIRHRWPVWAGPTLGGAILGLGLELGIESPAGSALRLWARGIVILGACVVGATFGLRRVRSRYAGRVPRVFVHLWTGWFGRTLFRLAGIGLQPVAAADRRAGANVPHLETLIDTLPAGSRKQLRGARAVVAAVTAALSAAEQRERELDRAYAEAGAGVVAGTGSAEESPEARFDNRRDQLLMDIQAARQTVSDRRTALLTALENLRLQLLRVRSGIGTVEDLEPDLAAARRLAEGRGEVPVVPNPLTTPV